MKDMKKNSFDESNIDYVGASDSGKAGPSETPGTLPRSPQHTSSPLDKVQAAAGQLLSKTRSSSFIRAPGTPILQVVMDRIEDEVEEHAYEDLVPLEIKLALEDKVFGWTHLTSSLLGHTCFTLGAYSITYESVSWVIHWVSLDRKLMEWLSWIRIVLSLWAAMSAFRVVRRRRRIWFRSAYGSKSYKDDIQRRRQMVAETDRTTTLGRFVQKFRHSRVLKKLSRAETQFAKKEEQRRSQHGLQHRRFNESMIQEDSERCSLLERNGSGDSDDEVNDWLMTQRSLDYESTDTSSDDSTGSPVKRRRRLDFSTKPTYLMHSIGHDEILMDETIMTMPYAHGSFFGAAPFMLCNPHWISLLRHLMPDVYVEISRRVAMNPPSRLIHWAENNPVVAAYGSAHAIDQRNFKRDMGDASQLPASSLIPNLEWDVFLDPVLVQRVQLVLDQQAQFEAQTHTPRQRTKKQCEQIKAYYETELKRRSQLLVDKMLIAHGNSLQLIIEQTGLAKGFNYSRIKRSRRTLGGGIYAKQWMAVFAEALKLGVCHEDDETRRSSPSKKSRGTFAKTASLLALAEATCPETSIQESVELVERITSSKQPLGVVLDLKSRHVPHKVWALVVDVLRNAGLRIEGVASFCMDEIRDLSRYSTTGRIPEWIFCHSAGDLQDTCHRNQIRSGDHIFFNAGSLFEPSGPMTWTSMLFGPFDPREVKDNYRIAPYGLPRTETTATMSCLQDYKEKYNLSIGLYCQEFAIDEVALQLLVDLVNEHSDLYDLGLSWGGINGITIKGIAPGRFTKTDGYWNQRHLGRCWNYSLHPASGTSDPLLSADRLGAPANVEDE